MEKMRLQKYMAKCGVNSRRKCEEIIKQGQVKVNDQIIVDMGHKVDENDDVKVNDIKIYIEEEKIYILLNKPCGHVTTVVEQFNRPTVMDLINEKSKRLYPVGRLDYNTSGLLLLTNDGDFTYSITHPKHKIEKIYVAKIKGVATSSELERFRGGLKIEDYTTSPAKIRVLQKTVDTSVVEVIIHEGRNRQVRKMCSEIGHEIIELQRIGLGNLKIGKLKIGEYRYLKEEELDKIFLKN